MVVWNETTTTIHHECESWRTMVVVRYSLPSSSRLLRHWNGWRSNHLENTIVLVSWCFNPHISRIVDELGFACKGSQNTYVTILIIIQWWPWLLVITGYIHSIKIGLFQYFSYHWWFWAKPLCSRAYSPSWWMFRLSSWLLRPHHWWPNRSVSSNPWSAAGNHRKSLMNEGVHGKIICEWRI